MISQLALAGALMSSGAITHSLEIGPDGQIQCVSVDLSHEEVAALRLPDGPKAVPVTVRRGPIEIHYFDFPEEAREAFQYGVDRWLELIDPRGPIQIDVRFRPPPESTAGVAVAAVYHGCSRSRLRACSATSLVNHVHERDLNLEQPDMSITFYDFQDSQHGAGGWYLGTDGQTPPSTLDLATAAMHEIAHGLGIVSWMRRPSEGVLERNQWQGSLDSLYESFLWTEAHGRVVDLPNPSRELHEAMTSGNLLWGSHLWDNQRDEPMLAPEVNRAPVPLRSLAPYGPETASHLDFYSYPKNSENSLMTYGYPGWSHHYPGPVILSMLYDMGWDLTEAGWNAIRGRRMTPRRVAPTGRPQQGRPERKR